MLSAAAQRWQDRYVAVFCVILAIAVAGQPIASALGGLARRTDPAQAGAGLAVIGLAFAGFLTLARTLGPVVLSAADVSWRLMSPLPRRTVLGRSALVLLVLSVLGGLALGVALVAVLGAPGQPVVRLTAFLVLGVCAGVGGMALALLGQAFPAWDGRLQAVIALTLAVSVLVAVLGAGPGRHLPAWVTVAPAGVAAGVAAAAAVVTASLARPAWAALGRMPARAILAASARTGRVAQATVLMDPGALSWVAEDNHWRGRTLRSRRWPVPGIWALAWQETRRASRRPLRLAVLAGATLLPALAAGAGLPTVATVLPATGALAAAVFVVAGARRDGDDPALLRLLAVSPRAALAARALPSALTGAAWLGTALGGLVLTGALAGGPWWPLALACGPALAAAALRMAGRRPVDHALPVLPTAIGALPTGPLVWALTGVDLALLGCAPTLLALATQPAALAPFLWAQALTGMAVLAGYLARR